MLHRNEEFRNFTEAGVRVGGGVSTWKPGDERMATAEIYYRNCIFRNATIGIGLYRWGKKITPSKQNTVPRLDQCMVKNIYWH
jgi:hypothetical protein